MTVGLYNLVIGVSFDMANVKEMCAEGHRVHLCVEQINGLELAPSWPVDPKVRNRNEES